MESKKAWLSLGKMMVTKMSKIIRHKVIPMTKGLNDDFFSKSFVIDKTNSPYKCAVVLQFPKGNLVLFNYEPAY